MTNTKTEWRRLLLEARRSLDSPLRDRLGAAIVERLRTLREFAETRAVLLYKAIGAEVDPLPLVAIAAGAGKSLYYPCADCPEPTWVGAAEARRPHVHAATLSRDGASIGEKRALVVVPGVGFDLQGVRLGRGDGFYDRALAMLRQSFPVFVVGVAFEIQVVPRLPRDHWDQPVDLVVTERRLIVPDTQLHPQSPRRHAEEVHEP